MSNQYIKLSPPLPLIGNISGPGFLHEISVNSVKVRFSDHTSGGHETLTVGLQDAKMQQFPIGDNRGYDLYDVPAEAADQVKDLMNILRKSQHIRICESMDVEGSKRYTGFEDLFLVPCTLPDLSLDEIDTSRQFLGRKFNAPLLITGMTGGLAAGAGINTKLAKTAARFGIPMGVGSQRLALENPDHAAIFDVKKDVPNVFLIGNIGVAQLKQHNFLDLCRRSVDMIKADALAIHVNVLQEVVQVEGDHDFKGLMRKIGDVVRALPVPVMVKEVGAGMDPKTATALYELGVAAIDCGGCGGTSWSLIEGARAANPVTQKLAMTFRDWGIPTAFSLAAIRKRTPGISLVATGGIRDGLMVGKALALGATMCGIGLPLLRAALANDPEACDHVIEEVLRGLKIAMICSGAGNIDTLTEKLHATERFHDLMSQYTVPNYRHIPYRN